MQSRHAQIARARNFRLFGAVKNFRLGWRQRCEQSSGATGTARSVNLIVDDLSRFLECGGRRWEWHRCGQFQPVLVIYRHHEPGLAREIEPMKMIHLGFDDHGLRSHAALKSAIACSRLGEYQ
jgi:hypothetical protein